MLEQILLAILLIGSIGFIGWNLFGDDNDPPKYNPNLPQYKPPAEIPHFRPNEPLTH